MTFDFVFFYVTVYTYVHIHKLNINCATNFLKQNLRKMDKLLEIHGKTLSFDANSVSIDPEKNIKFKNLSN